jgi:hypothetical protein
VVHLWGLLKVLVFQIIRVVCIIMVLFRAKMFWVWTRIWLHVSHSNCLMESSCQEVDNFKEILNVFGLLIWGKGTEDTVDVRVFWGRYLLHDVHQDEQIAEWWSIGFSTCNFYCSWSYLLVMHTLSFSATNAQMLLFKFAATAFAMGCSMRHHCWWVRIQTRLPS